MMKHDSDKSDQRDHERRALLAAQVDAGRLKVVK